MNAAVQMADRVKSDLKANRSRLTSMGGGGLPQVCDRKIDPVISNLHCGFLIFVSFHVFSSVRIGIHIFRLKSSINWYNSKMVLTMTLKNLSKLLTVLLV